MSDDQSLRQEDIDAALGGLSGSGDESAEPETNAPAPESDGSVARKSDAMVEDANVANEAASSESAELGPDAGGGAVGQNDIDALLNEMEQRGVPEASSADAPLGTGDTPATDSPPPEAEPMSLPDWGAGSEADQLFKPIELLKDVGLQVKIELGRSRMLIEDVVRLGEGSVVELDKLAGDPVDVYVNDRLVARGEVLVLNDNFCVRVNEIVSDLWKEFQTA